MQLLESPKTLYSDYSVSWRDDNSLISLDIDLISRIKIEELREKLDRDVIYDQLVMMTMAGGTQEKLVKAWKIQKLGELCGEQNCYDTDYNYDNNIDENRDDDENGRTIQIEIPIKERI